MEQSPLESGEWTGFYLEPYLPRRSWMHFYMEFKNTQIRGEGTDYVGPWSAQGRYDLGALECLWTKQYVGLHQVVYSGSMHGTEILGEWKIESCTGSFHIWPVTNSGTTEFYLSKDQDLPAQRPRF